MENQKGSYKLIILVVFLLVVAGVISIYYYSKQQFDFPLIKKMVINQQKAPTENPNPGNLSQTTASLYRVTGIAPAPEVFSSSQIDESQLPAGLTDLVNPDQHYLSVSKVKFYNNRDGYRIQYQLESMINQNQTYYMSLQNSGWKVGPSPFWGTVGLVELSKDNFKALVEESVIDNKNINVIVTVY